ARFGIARLLTIQVALAMSFCLSFATPRRKTHECEHKSNGVSCNDGNECTTNDTCHGSACVGHPLECTAIDQCHTAGTCDPSTGSCSNPAAADGTACDDSNACTHSDGCQAGSCVGTDPVVCAASDQCHTAGTCDPSTGACSDPAAA